MLDSIGCEKIKTSCGLPYVNGLYFFLNSSPGISRKALPAFFRKILFALTALFRFLSCATPNYPKPPATTRNDQPKVTAWIPLPRDPRTPTDGQGKGKFQQRWPSGPNLARARISTEPVTGRSGREGRRGEAEGGVGMAKVSFLIFHGQAGGWGWNGAFSGAF